jgi:hypothetical protein
MNKKECFKPTVMKKTRKWLKNIFSLLRQIRRRILFVELTLRLRCKTLILLSDKFSLQIVFRFIDLSICLFVRFVSDSCQLVFRQKMFPNCNEEVVFVFVCFEKVFYSNLFVVFLKNNHSQ